MHDRSGARATGRLTRLTRDEIVLQTDAGEKRFTGEAVREVAVRVHALGRSALIGAGAFAVLGAVAASRNDNAGAGPAGAAAVGAGIGVAVGSLIPTMRTICRAPADGASVESHPECADGIVLVGGAAAGIGAIAGALIGRTTIVYSRPGKGTFVMPAISRTAAGVQAGLRW